MILLQPEQHDRWVEVCTREYEHLQGGRDRLLSSYAGVNVGEFFAVATETFFEQPDAMAKRHQELFGVLKDYYRVDPRDWRETRAAAAGGAPEDSK